MSENQLVNQSQEPNTATSDSVAIEATDSQSGSGGKAKDPTRFVDRSFACVWNEGHSIRLINRDDPRQAISIPWDDLPALRSLLITSAENQGDDAVSYDMRQAAFHRGVDAAKDAIRSEECGEGIEHDFCAATFINAIARKCGRDTQATNAAASAGTTQQSR